MSEDTLAERINIVRHFNRFITKQMGVLHEGLLHSPYSLTESRIIFELANRENLTASDLIEELGLDAGYLSRILKGLEGKGIIEKTRSADDGRQLLLFLTPEGRNAYEMLDKRSREEVREMLSALSELDQQRLIKAMQTIEDVFGNGDKCSRPYVLRPHEPGDLGWIVHRHGVLYTEEYGWDEQFEALVTQIAANFMKKHDPKKERCWIAEMDGEKVGSIMIAQESEKVARLRLFLVEPKARGLGIGTRLVEESIRFSRRAGYEKIILWTYNVLAAARHTYEKKGFKLIKAEQEHSYGQDLVSETWELTL